MKCSESWLREWVNPPISREALCELLTMSGLEVESVTPAAHFHDVIIGQVTNITKHPNKDHLHVCEVDIGKQKLQIVCGAPNVKMQTKVPVALVGASLGAEVVKETEIQGVRSSGMLCSAKELGLSEDHEGLLVLPGDAPVGKDLKTYLEIDDYVIEIAITPNRGDCLSIKGLAREVSAITNTTLTPIDIRSIASINKTTIPVTVKDKKSCPSYVGRVIKNVDITAKTPHWLETRLHQAGIRAINPVVDVANYLMLELGQPMHAFDLDKIDHEIIVRQSKSGEEISLLDGSERKLDGDTLVIADRKNPQAIAGVMGGIDSSVTSLTHNIFLESAFFLPNVIARQRQHYQLDSDSSYRYERGVDPTIQQQAIERATQLILEITGGEPGPIIAEISEKDLPSSAIIKVSAEKVKKIIGIEIETHAIEAIFTKLTMPFKKLANEKDVWQVEVPPYRFDLKQSEDLVEEIARLYGYDNIPTLPISALLTSIPDANFQNLQSLRQTLRDQGFHEIISYSFVEKNLQQLLDPDHMPLELINPITSDMTVMRTNLWPGLLKAMLYNKNRQQEDIRLFEIGSVFLNKKDQLLQESRMTGLITGSVSKEQWAISSREADFFDLKGQVDALLALHNPSLSFVYKQSKHPALHPGQSATIYLDDMKIGELGALHPRILKALDLNKKVFVFELDLNLLKNRAIRQFKEISKFPEIRRDVALLVNEAIPGKDIQDTIKVIAGDWLKDIFIFDVYKGKGISPGLKSIALALILQHPTRTLVDDEVTELMGRVIAALKGQLGAELRS